MFFIKEKFFSILYYLCFLVLILIVYRFYGALDFGNADKSVGFYQIINSDSTTLYRYCCDLLAHPSHYEYWNLGTAWGLFPTILLMSIWAIIPVGPSMAHCLFGLSQVFILLLLLNVFLKKLNPSISKISLTFANLVLMLFFVYSISQNEFAVYTSSLILPYHTGITISMLFGLLLFVAYLKYNSKISLLLYSLLAILCIVSNNLFVIYVSAPLIGVLSICLFLKSGKRQQYLTFLIVNIVTSGIGYLLFRWLFVVHILTISDTNYINTSAIISSFHTLFAQYYSLVTNIGILGFITWLSIAGFLMAVSFSIKLFRKQIISDEQRIISIVSLFVVFFTMAAFFAPALVGRYENANSIRYNIALLYVLPFITIFYVDHLLKDKLKRILFLGFVVVLFVVEFFCISTAWRVNKPFEVIHEINNYYPTEAAAVDKLAELYPIKRGISDYWTSKIVTLYSKRTIKVNSVYSSLVLYHHANTMYGSRFVDENNTEFTRYNFIIMTNFGDTTRIHQIFKPHKLKSVVVNDIHFYLTPDFVFDGEYGQAKIVKQ